MKKTKLLSLLGLIPLTTWAIPTISSCEIGGKSVSTCVVTVKASTGGTVTGPSTLTVNSGTTWGDIESNWQTSPEANYSFKGWYNGNTAMSSTDEIKSDMTITAQFQQLSIPCEVTFAAGTGGSITGTTTVTVEKGTKWKEIANKPTVTCNDDYEFDAWYIGDTKITDSTKITEAVTITAKFTKIEITGDVVEPVVYLYNKTTTKYEKYGNPFQGYDNLNIVHFNNSPMGYINIDWYLGGYWGSYYRVETANHKTTITNLITKSTADNTCVIDHDKQTITFANYENFFDLDSDSYGPMAAGCAGGHAYINSCTVKEYVNNALTIDLTKYNIRTYCYKGTNAEASGFMPWEFLKNVFDCYVSVQNPTGTYHTNLDYNGSGLYEIYSGYDATAVALKKEVKAAAATNFYSTNYMEYLYNLLALTLDLRYGLVERKSRYTPGTTIKYLENGAYETLEPFHDDLVSTDDDVSSDALRSVFKLLDDGGHTLDWNLNALATTPLEAKASVLCGLEYKHTAQIMSKMKAARNSKSITTGYQEYTNAGYDTIAYITFDSFAAQSGLDSSAGETKRELPAGTTDSNYMNDTLRMTMYANQKIKANNIKNVVVDLSCNGGGAVYTEFFLASWLCGGVTQKVYNPKTNSYCEYTVKADINGDGSFTVDDYLPSTVNLYVITSSGSFSCGNMLPCNVQDNRTANTHFIGTSSGGGACYVDYNIWAGANGIYQISSLSHMLRKSSTSTNFITVDDGCSIDYPIDESSPNDYFDRETINKKIWGIEPW